MTIEKRKSFWKRQKIIFKTRKKIYSKVLLSHKSVMIIIRNKSSKSMMSLRKNAIKKLKSTTLSKKLRNRKK